MTASGSRLDFMHIRYALCLRNNFHLYSATYSGKHLLWTPVRSLDRAVPLSRSKTHISFFYIFSGYFYFSSPLMALEVDSFQV